MQLKSFSTWLMLLFVTHLSRFRDLFSIRFREVLILYAADQFLLNWLYYTQVRRRAAE